MGPPPGTCVDCGNDAYIKLDTAEDAMVCAHCFAARARRDAGPRQPASPEPEEQIQRQH